MKTTETTLRELIRKLLKETLSEECGCDMPECSICHPTSRPTDDVTEMTGTASIDGYQTPFAFDDEDEEGHASKIKDTAEVFDFETTTNEKSNTVAEGRSLYHLYRDHPDMNPRQKIGVTIREVNKMLVEVEKLIKVSSKFKAESDVGNESYWKTTTRYLDKLDTRLQRIAEKVRELR